MINESDIKRASVLTLHQPVPCFEGITSPLEQITLHNDPVLGVHIVLQLGVVIRIILRKHTPGVGTL